MKKQLILSALAALALCACGNKNKIEPPTAFGVLERLNPEQAKANEPSDDSPVGNQCIVWYADGDYERDVMTRVFQNTDGEWFALYQEARFIPDEFEEILRFEAYRFNGTELTLDNSLLPRPTFDDYAAMDELLWYKNEDMFSKAVADHGYIYQMCDTDGVFVRAHEDMPALYFKWDGRQFAPNAEDYNDGICHTVITMQGLGNVHIGDVPPATFRGYTYENGIYNFRRSGEAFSFALNAEGAIDTISVYNLLYLYQMCAGDECDYYGVTSQNIGYAFGESGAAADYFVFKNGVWVRTLEDVDGGAIDFYTTPEAISNIYPEEGKKVLPADNPEFADFESISEVKIYRKK